MLTSLSSEQQAKLKTLYNFSDTMFEKAEQENKQIMVILGTWTDTENATNFDAYVKAQEEIARRYASRNTWARSCLVNIARSGYFSSDRTIEEYAHDIWDLQKLHF